MPLYVADYLADTNHLTTLEHGAYLLLIMHYWRVGSLPDDDRKLANICRVSAPQWRAVRDTLSAFFSAGWRHSRIEKELDVANRKSELRAQIGALGGKAKALKSKEPGLAKATDLLSVSHKQNGSQALPSSSYQEATNVASLPSAVSEAKASVVRPKKIRMAVEYPEDFKRFWSEYPTDANMSKQEAYAEWGKLSAENREKAIFSCRPFRSYCSTRPDYRPVHANRYLSQGRFEGHAAVAAQTSKSVFVRIGSPQWVAWDAEYRRTRGQTPPVNKEGNGWHFPSEYPPDHSEDHAA